MTTTPELLALRDLCSRIDSRSECSYATSGICWKAHSTGIICYGGLPI